MFLDNVEQCFACDLHFCATLLYPYVVPRRFQAMFTHCCGQNSVIVSA